MCCLSYKLVLFCFPSHLGIATALQDTVLVKPHCRKPCSSLHLLSIKQNTKTWFPTPGENKGTGVDNYPAVRMLRGAALFCSELWMPSDRVYY